MTFGSASGPACCGGLHRPSSLAATLPAYGDPLWPLCLMQGPGTLASMVTMPWSASSPSPSTSSTAHSTAQAVGAAYTTPMARTPACVMRCGQSLGIVLSGSPADLETRSLLQLLRSWTLQTHPIGTCVYDEVPALFVLSVEGLCCLSRAWLALDAPRQGTF